MWGACTRGRKNKRRTHCHGKGREGGSVKPAPGVGASKKREKGANPVVVVSRDSGPGDPKGSVTKGAK